VNEHFVVLWRCHHASTTLVAYKPAIHSRAKTREAVITLTRAKPFALAWKLYFVLALGESSAGPNLSLGIGYIMNGRTKQRCREVSRVCYRSGRKNDKQLFFITLPNLHKSLYYDNHLM